LPRLAQACARGRTVADDCFARPTGARRASATPKQQSLERARSHERLATGAAAALSLVSWLSLSLDSGSWVGMLDRHLP
jgi:hypothetical protein